MVLSSLSRSSRSSCPLDFGDPPEEAPESGELVFGDVEEAEEEGGERLFVQSPAPAEEEVEAVALRPTALSSLLPSSSTVPITSALLCRWRKIEDSFIQIKD